MFIISIPKGRNFFFSIFFLKKNNIFVIEKIYRKILLKTNRIKIFLIIVKNKDIVKMYYLNITDFLILGSDIFKKKNLLILKLNSILYLNNKNYIFTKFINLYKYFYFKKKIIKVSGNLEFYLKFNKVGIIDITETNKTLYINDFFPKKILSKINLTIIIKNKKYVKNII